MPEAPFIVTIDAEGDNLWAKPRTITTRNADYLPRFQALCERFGFKPVYLATHEMAMSHSFVEFMRDVLKRGAGEIGMHLHAWNSPPIEPLTGDDHVHQPYLIEYPLPLMRQKVHALTDLLEELFDRDIVSHRAGRWALDGRYAGILLEEGYRIDCSVTPGIDWSAAPGDPRGSGGADYTAFPAQPYFLDPDDISRPEDGVLLEVPVTIRAGDLYRKLPWAYRVRGLRRLARSVSPGPAWLCPAENGIDEMLRVTREARAEGTTHLEFMLHSSELMPGGSPSFRTVQDIERLYKDMEVLFAELSSWCRGITLGEFHSRLARGGMGDVH